MLAARLWLLSCWTRCYDNVSTALPEATLGTSITYSDSSQAEHADEHRRGTTFRDDRVCSSRTDITQDL